MRFSLRFSAFQVFPAADWVQDKTATSCYRFIFCTQSLCRFILTVNWVQNKTIAHFHRFILQSLDILQLEYEYVEEDKKVNPIRVRKLTPIQMPHIDLDEVRNGRKAFTKDELAS